MRGNEKLVATREKGLFITGKSTKYDKYQE